VEVAVYGYSIWLYYSNKCCVIIYCAIVKFRNAAERTEVNFRL